MQKKQKTLPSIEANAGTRRKFKKTLEKISQAFFLRVSQDLLSEAVSAGIAQDASPKKTIAQRLVNGVKKKTDSKALYRKQDVEEITAQVDLIITRHLSEWVTDLGSAVSDAVKRYARTVLAEVSADQRKALIRSGVPDELIKNAWTVPALRGRYVSPQAQLELEALAQEATDTICRGYADGIERVRRVLIDSLTQGQDLRELARAISMVDVVRKNKSEFDALDVSNRFSQSIEMANSQALGITKGIWVHVSGAYTSRETHKKFDGKKFDLNKGLYDKDFGGYVRPAQLRFCRCTYRQVLPDWITGK